MRKTESETRALRFYVALRDNLARYWRGEWSLDRFRQAQTETWDRIGRAGRATEDRVLALLRADMDRRNKEVA